MTDAAAPTAKVDPETLAIRTRPPRAIRFKRGVIVALAAAGSAGLFAVTFVALRPHIQPPASPDSELSVPSLPSRDALAGAPATYGDVPKLGPPLPGDLGRPILEHERGEAAVAQAPQPAQIGADQQQGANRMAARASGLLVQRQPGQAPTASVAPPAVDVPANDAAGRLTLDPDRDPNAQGHKSDFTTTLDPRGAVNPHTVASAPSPYTLLAGSVIAASLITGLRSDLPGMVTAQVTENVHDSATGRILLIPQGARLIGSYDSVIAFGQRRALLIWQRIILPDGRSLRLDNMPATDPSGYAGLEDKADFHSWQMLKGIALSTLLGVGSEFSLSGQGDLVQALRMSTQDTVSRAGDKITERNIGIQPTITIRPGAPVRLVVQKDLVFTPLAQEEN